MFEHGDLFVLPFNASPGGAVPFISKGKTMSNKTEKLRIIPIGGLGEVGKNMMVYEYNGQILIVDAGLMFPDNDMLGVDYIIPDFKYLRTTLHRFWESLSPMDMKIISDASSTC
jgi:mRNA degradation ribonuclease J1/J2